MPDLDETMRGYAEKAVAEARERLGITLDFSPASAERVEEMAAAIHTRRQRRLHADEYADPSPDWDPSEEAEYPQLALVLGAYLGELIRRKWGGAWENPGQGARLRVGGEDLNTCGLVYFRITQGRDNLSEYYQRVAKKLEGQTA